MAASGYVDNSKHCTTLAPTRNVDPLDLLGNTDNRELHIEKPNYLPKTKAEACKHQPDVPGDTPLGRGTPALTASLASKITAFVALVAILYVAKAKLKDAFTLINDFVSIEDAFGYLSITFHNQRHAVAWSLRTAQPHAGHYHCATQRRSHARLRVGTDGLIPRWTKGSTVKYVVCAKTFPTPDMATYTAGKLAEAISMWKGKGVRFQQVYPTCKATFKVIYEDKPVYDCANVYAEAFFPSEYSPMERSLRVYGLALNEGNRGYLANILSHEIGHIMGLRHEFAAKSNSGETGSVLWGKENDSSIMNYFDHPSKWRVQKQDLNDLKSFYESTEKKHEELVIREFEPPMLFYQ
ncbi:hypothetical protein DL764_000420 [Monosporascus ibericus]|uniref:Peptidase metallopeptidase domain-containing protein n=1 Tax=Monosporascus ibericus TaxID=155417 RepID=A0A4Q4TVD1_9PEZI|nr:hypothetical protein DL764_000420 [Monosporascus ibericus]